MTPQLTPESKTQTAVLIAILALFPVVVVVSLFLFEKTVGLPRF
ncbi:hypothetical protein [Haloarchaeobius sp. HRN-SO-5]